MNIPDIFDEIIDAWADVLEGDAGLTAWCQSQYSAAPYIYRGVDEHDLPQKEHCPFVALLPGEDTTGLAVEEFSYSVDLVCMVKEKDGGKTVTDTRKIDYPAARRASAEFGSRVLNILAATEYTPDVVQGSFNLGDFPFVSRILRVTTNVPAVLDGGRTW